jgi:hypothetical protein
VFVFYCSGAASVGGTSCQTVSVSTTEETATVITGPPSQRKVYAS